jgi:hypothetical protein
MKNYYLLNMYNMFDITIGTYKVKGEYILIFIVLWSIMFGTTMCGCSRVGLLEGFSELANSASYKLGDTTPVDISKWRQPDLSTKAGAASILNRPPQPIPLPEGEMDIFATTEFKPECCPNAYSTSNGCACMTMKQLSYIKGRGGNNVPYSEY